MLKIAILAVLDGDLDRFIEASLKKPDYKDRSKTTIFYSNDKFILQVTSSRGVHNDRNNSRIGSQWRNTSVVKISCVKSKRQRLSNTFRRNALAQDLHTQYDEIESESLKTQGIEVKVAGRIMTRRVMGKATFITLQDMSGKLNFMLLVIT